MLGSLLGTLSCEDVASRREVDRLRMLQCVGRTLVCSLEMFIT
jgi:hypothetical protein